ncbi:GrpB family protein [Micromonospora sp. MS34]|uniref:GrpB family protein n=1 Tax=Micromonospora sp. MS34 TaxID=3385971 RepID=UPI0039A0C5A2
MEPDARSEPFWYRVAAVRISDYDPAWPQRYAAESARITEVLTPRLVAIEHVGSTAVPGMAAKPIIDMLVAVPTYDDFPDVVRRLHRIGYRYTPESETSDPDRRVFRKGPDDITRMRSHHLHLTAEGSRYWRRLIAFRDHLRRHPAEADAYVRLKRALAARYADDSARYTDGKHGFVVAAQRQAGVD